MSCFLCVSHCHQNKSKEENEPKIKFHRFPKNKALYQKWIKFCKICGADTKSLSKCARLCSNHFTDDDYKIDLRAQLMHNRLDKILSPDAVPTISEKKSCSSSTRKIERSERAKIKERKEFVDKIINNFDISNSDQNIIMDSSKDCDDNKNLDKNTTTTASNKRADDGIFPNDGGIDDSNLTNSYVYTIKLEIDKNDKDQADNQLIISELKNKINELNQNMQNLQNYAIGVENCNRLLSEENLSLKEQQEKKLLKYFEKIFTQTQLDIILQKKKKVVWKTEDIRLAFKIKCLSKKSYLFLKKTMHIPLPHLATLRRWRAAQKTTYTQKREKKRKKSGENLQTKMVEKIKLEEVEDVEIKRQDYTYN